MWCLMEDPSSWSVAHEKNVVRVGGSEISVGAKHKFYYKGNEYEGKVLMKSNDQDELITEIARLKKTLGKPKRDAPKDQSTGNELPSKRRVTAVNFYGSSVSNSSKPSKPVRNSSSRNKMTEEEKAKLKLAEKNKASARVRSNKEVLTSIAQTQEEKRDPDYNPLDDNEDESQDSVIKDMVAHGNAMKANRQNLMKGLASTSTSTSGSSSESPSKEDLKRELRIMQIKLQMAYDATSTGKDDNDSDGNSFGPSGDEKSKDEIEQKLDVDDIEQKLDVDDTTANDSSHDLNASGLSKTESEGGMSSADKLVKDDKKDLDDDTPADENTNLKLLEYQLYGQQPDTVLLCRGIYCKKSTYTKAISNAGNVNHLIRRLMAGVFIPSKVLNCTISGQDWRARGADLPRPEKDIDPLHPTALKAICDVANHIAKENHWPTKKFSKCSSVFSGRLVEIKKAVKSGSLRD